MTYVSTRLVIMSKNNSLVVGRVMLLSRPGSRYTMHIHILLLIFGVLFTNLESKPIPEQIPQNPLGRETDPRKDEVVKMRIAVPVKADLNVFNLQLFENILYKGFENKLLEGLPKTANSGVGIPPPDTEEIKQMQKGMDDVMNPILDKMLEDRRLIPSHEPPPKTFEEWAGNNVEEVKKALGKS